MQIREYWYMPCDTGASFQETLELKLKDKVGKGCMAASIIIEAKPTVKKVS